MIKEFDKSFMLAVLNEEHPGAKILENVICDQTRWSTIYDFTFSYGGKYWNTSYSVGSTEHQDEGPWDYEDKVKCTEVRPVEKTIIVYKPVEDTNESEGA